MKITIIAGARPNFMKIAPIIHSIYKVQSEGKKVEFRLIHTGQHYDRKMSDDFFEQLNIPAPTVNLGAGGGSQAQQTASIMIGIESELIANTPDVVLVVGDVTSTMACCLTAKKLNIDVAHVEAGIRSGDRSMPEEINRMVTDAISDYFFTTSPSAGENLVREGVSREKIFFVGNTMVDTLLKQIPNLIKPAIWDQIGLVPKNYIVMTLHRPANVDQDQHLNEVLDQIIKASRGIPLVFPVHPRTAQILNQLSLDFENLHLIDPLSYLEFNYLVKNSKAVITDSGGITEETTMMGIPCMTLRNNTERPETCSIGTNELIGTDPKAIPPAMNILFDNKWKKGEIPEKWDGHTAERIIDILSKIYE